MRIFVNSTGLGSTVVSAAADALSSDGVATVTSPGADIDNHPSGQALIQWMTQMHYTPVGYGGGEGVLLASQGHNGNTIVLQHYAFSTDTWTRKFNQSTSEGLPTAVGHVYSGDAFDSTAGRYYYHVWNQKDPWYYDWGDSGLSELTLTHDLDDESAIATEDLQALGMAWHPNLYGSGVGGLLYHMTDKTTGVKISTLTADEIASHTYCSIESVANYIPYADAVICGGGNRGTGTPTALRKITVSGSTPSKAEISTAAPCEASVSEDGPTSDEGNADIYPSPLSGDERIFLIRTGEDPRYYTSDDLGDTWSSRQEFPSGLVDTANAVAWVPLHVHGCFMLAYSASQTSVPVKLWQPPAAA